MFILKNEIVSSSEVVRNFSSLRRKVKENSKMVIFKNNKPDLVLFDFDEYEKILERINNMEDLLIAKSIEERDKKDDGARHSFEDVKISAKEHLKK